MTNNPHDYLSRMGFSIGAKKGKSRETVVTNGPGMSPTMPNDRRLAVKEKTMSVSGSTRGVGSLGSTANNTADEDAPQEFNESATYEAAEGKTLKGLKGSKKKILREGHNTKGKMPYPTGKKAAGKMEKTMHEFKTGGLHSGSKKGPKVTNRKQAIAIGLSQARKAEK